MGLIGSARQAKSHYRYMTAGPSKSQVFSPTRIAKPSRRDVKGTGVAGEPVASPEEAVRGCDVICSATNSSRPVVKIDWLEAGMHYNSIREFETDLDVLNKCDPIAIHTQFGGIQHYQPPGIIEDMPGVRREKPRDWTKYPEIWRSHRRQSTRPDDDRQISFFLNNVGTGVQFRRHGFLRLHSRQRERHGAMRSPRCGGFLQDIKP